MYFLKNISVEHRTFADKDKDRDLANHQSFKVSKIIFHWKTQQDAALIRLFSSDKSGKCIQWSRTAQPACLLKSAVSGSC